MLIHTIAEDCGIQIGRYERVPGGDINHAYCLHSNGTRYFLKINDELRYPQMFAKETSGLAAIRDAFRQKVPAVIKHGAVEGTQYLLLEWLEPGTPRHGFWERFGRAIAEMHRVEQPFFGWEEDNFIGSLIQTNGRHADWPTFYAQCRILPLVYRIAETGGFTPKDVKAAEKLCSKLGELYPPEQPSLLHGDLWSGNFVATADGSAAIYDPAVYYGHREMDIAMTRLFGGFPEEFYSAYNTVYPLAHGWEQRMSLSQLYPLLVHAVLFGGRYVDSVRGIIA
ncbi:MAG: fructosamine kinase family protein [Bacteroidota bacterium]